MIMKSVCAARLRGRGLILALLLGVVIADRVVAGPFDWLKVRAMPHLPLFRTGDEEVVSLAPSSCGSDKKWQPFFDLDPSTSGAREVHYFLADQANTTLCKAVDPVMAESVDLQTISRVKYGEQFALLKVLGVPRGKSFLNFADCVEARKAFWLSSLLSSTDLSHPAHMAFWKDKAAFFFPNTWKTNPKTDHQLLVPRMEKDEHVHHALECLKRNIVRFTGRWEGMIRNLQAEGKEREKHPWVITQAAIDFKYNQSRYTRDPSTIKFEELFDLTPVWRGNASDVAAWISRQLLYKKSVAPDPNAPAFRAAPNDHHSAHGDHGSHAHDPHSVPGRRPGPYTQEPGQEWEDFNAQLRFNNRNKPAFPPRIPIRR